MMIKHLAAGAAAMVLSMAGAAQAAVIHALPGGTAAPIASVPSEWTLGPKTTVGGAITWTSTTESIFGYGGDSWQFGDNGEWFTPTLAALGPAGGAMTFTFSTPVAAFLAEFNWGDRMLSPTTLEAYDVNGNLLESLELANGWTNSVAPGVMGFTRSSADIGSFVLRSYNNAAAGVRDISYSFTPAWSGGVPEPATWAMMIIGFGAAGVMVRRRRLEAQGHVQA